MPKKEFVIVTIILSVLVIVCFVFWQGELNRSTITGNAYVDCGAVGAYDGDPPATGLVVQLYEFGKNTPVQETLVDEEGKYEFPKVPPGIYYIQPAGHIPGYPAWDYITILRGGNILVKKSHHDGPIILVRQWGRG